MSSPKTNVGVIGASGYSGEELVRLLSHHPHVHLASVSSRSLVGQSVVEALPALRGHIDEQFTFDLSDAKELAAREDIDTFFLAVPHGVATDYARELIAGGKRVIDLSADFRLTEPELYHRYYGKQHPAPELLESSPYVIPELCEVKDWQQARLIACPGCYPTSILMPLIPLLKAGIISTEHIVANSYSGVSGAGKKAIEAYLFCERAESIKAYGLAHHRHLSEIEEQLSLTADKEILIQFNPHLAPMRRGIATTIVADALEDKGAYECLREFYKDSAFVDVLISGKYPDTRYVCYTNNIQISALYDKRTKRWLITSVIDNLLKGASGQAVQILNHCLGLEETCGLKM